MLFFSAQLDWNVVSLFHPALRAMAEFEQLTSLPISICERKGKFLHSSFWRAYYQGHPFVFIQQNRKFPNHSPLILKSGGNLLPPQDNKDTVRRGADFPSPYYMCEVTSRSEGSLPLKHECSRTARWPAGKSKLRRWTWKLKASGFENEEMCDVGPLGIIGAP